MFNWFGRKTAKDFMDEAKETYQIPELPKVEPPKEPRPKEYYRVGRTDNGMTTLTLLADSGYNTMTLTMNKEACQQLIRMLESTYDVEETEQQ